MPWNTDIRPAILRALADEPADLYTVADTISEPPFRVRAELLSLRRDRLVRRRADGLRMIWGLTSAGAAAVWTQPELPEAR